MRYALTFSLICIVSGAFCQQSAAARDFFDALTDCSTSFGGWKCLELDLSSTASEENDSTKVYEYSWNFGDGNRKAGSKIEHCYEEFGIYQVTMDLIDTETGTVMRNELSSTVALYPEIHPEITIRTENIPPSFMAFSCTYNDEDQFAPDRVYWRIDGFYYEGNTIMHAFPVAGLYMVEMGLEKDTDLFGVVSACSQMQVTIKESDVWSTQISKFVKTAREATGAGPFASSEIFCFIRPLSGEEMKAACLIPLSRLMLQMHLKTEREYEIMLVAGNSFTRKKHLSTAGITGSNLYKALRDTVSSFVDQPLFVFPSVKFEKNQITRPADLSAVKEVAKLLLEYDFFSVEIGAYLHTGSRSIPGVNTSLRRAQLIREVLVEFGVDPQRVSIASPEFNRELMNTCSADPDCSRENSAMNGIVELKITGVNL